MKTIAWIVNVSFFVAVGSAIWGALSQFGLSPRGVFLVALICLIAAVIVGMLIEWGKLKKTTEDLKKEGEKARKEAGI